MRQNYNEWMAEAVKELTPAGNLKKPSYEIVAKWVRDSWNAVDPEDEVEMPSDKHGNDEEGKTDGEYVGKERETDEKYINEEEEEDDEEEYEGKKDDEEEYERKKMKRENMKEKRMDIMMNIIVITNKEQITLTYGMISG
ncbi:uncharacterized protein OCT59_012094 [Rhizophagus irregularis]|nr:hypothetical protein OCT59_012094 [Rhizophagus irregularis]GBC39912.2 hypothetical protein RIR_jg7427.t1 [Rhizophagus irregularis DAOM 181602=DAOM 197198]